MNFVVVGPQLCMKLGREKGHQNQTNSLSVHVGLFEPETFDEIKGTV